MWQPAIRAATDRRSATDACRPKAAGQPSQTMTPDPLVQDRGMGIRRSTLLSRGGLPRRAAGAATLVATALALPGCAFKHFAPIPYRPALYEAIHPQLPGKLVLFGSVHAGIPRFYPLPDAVEAAYRRADRLAIELDVASHIAELRQAIAPMSVYAPGHSLETAVSRQLVSELRAHLKYDAHEWRRTMLMKPWAIALSMVSVDDAGLAASSAQGIEAFMLESARRDRKPILELETATEQAHAFAGGSDNEQEAMLALRLRQLKAFDRTFSHIVDAWRVGDVDRLGALKVHAYPVDGVLGEGHRRVFTERDTRMARRLATIAEQPGTVLVVVGAFHLAGDQSVVTRLRDAGFDVQRIGYER